MQEEENWPFEEPRTQRVFTVVDVFSGGKPVLLVSHEVADGWWQFLAGDDVDGNQVKLVSLGELVERDPTLLALADLPLGWSAERECVTDPWVRTPLHPTDWDELMRAAVEYTEEQQARLEDEFFALEWTRFDFLQKGASLVFSSGGAERLTMEVQVVGSFSNISDTWLWSWANVTILDEAARCVHVLRDFGMQHGFEKLSTAKWDADETDGWDMAAVACLLLEGDGVYRAPSDHGFMFMVITNPQIVNTC